MKARKPSSKKKPRRLRGWRRLLVLASIPVLILFVCVFLVYSWRASQLDLKEVGQIPQRSFVYDVNGAPYSRLYGENRVLVKIEDVSPKFIEALLAREDSRFYSHKGVDPIGIARAIVRNVLGGKFGQGASTITQQLARNSFELGGKTLDRKLLEAFVAFRIENTFTKRQILENYINRIYYGAGYYGLEIATQAYFGKHCKDLTMGEAAMMAGLIRSPNRFSPLKHLPEARRERDTVLDRLVKLDKLPLEEANKAKRAPINVANSSKPAVQQNYVMDAVDQELQVLLEQDQIDEGGMKIYTTINAGLQKAAEESLDEQLTKIEQRPGYPHPKKADFVAADSKKTNYLQGAVVVIDNRTGGICALVGGRDYAQSDFNRSLLGFRQIGSTIKPFVYATAFTRGLQPGARSTANPGLLPETEISDGPLQSGEIAEASEWRPGNSDGTNKGILPARDGLILSRNTMTVRVGEAAGLENVRKQIAKVGISEAPDFPSIFLGAFETTPRNLTSAYTVFPNQGRRKQAYLIERIDDKFGNPVYRAAHIETKAMDPVAAWYTTSAMQEVFTRGTASSARSLGFNKIAGGKTGTTNDYKDAWFVGFTKSLTCGVWVGLDDPEPIVPRGYGGTLALPVWINVINSASTKQYPAGEFEPGAVIPKPQQSGRPVFGFNGNQEPDKTAPLPSRIFDSISKFFRGKK